MRRFSFYVLAGLILLAGGAYFYRGELANEAMKVVLKRNIGVDATAHLPDGLHVVLCGTGTPIPDAQRAGPCTAVIAGTSLFVIDAGSGGARNLTRMQIPTGRIRAVFLTHFHSDHIDGLGEMGVLRWVPAGHQEPLCVVGPVGVAEVVSGFNQAYRADAGYRTVHHGSEVAPPSGAGLIARSFAMPADGEWVQVWDTDGVTITAFAVDHRPAEPSVGYKIAYKGRIAVLSGDTRKSANLEKMAGNADLLVHSGLCRELVDNIRQAAQAAAHTSLARIFEDIPDYHTTPVQAAEIASAAGVTALVFTHVVPGLPLPGMNTIYLRGTSRAFGGTIKIGRDGMLISMQAGNKQVKFFKMM